jgi:hypothetical protein
MINLSSPCASSHVFDFFDTPVHLAMGRGKRSKTARPAESYQPLEESTSDDELSKDNPPKQRQNQQPSMRALHSSYYYRTNLFPERKNSHDSIDSLATISDPSGFPDSQNRSDESVNSYSEVLHNHGIGTRAKTKTWAKRLLNFDPLPPRSPKLGTFHQKSARVADEFPSTKSTRRKQKEPGSRRKLRKIDETG